jgi:hypothetical protein
VIFLRNSELVFLLEAVYIYDLLVFNVLLVLKVEKKGDISFGSPPKDNIREKPEDKSFLFKD